MSRCWCVKLKKRNKKKLNQIKSICFPPMPASYPYFDCISCRARVQKATAYTVGALPVIVVNDKRTKLSSQFDRGNFARHCRGQGLRYNDPGAPAFAEFVDDYHYNFAGYFNGFCCFCALHGGFGSELFLTSCCFNCRRKEVLRSEFSRLYRLKGASSWEDGGWAALPSAMLDHILRHFVGEALLVSDGAVSVRKAEAK